MGPQTEFSKELHKLKYRLKDETFEEFSHRFSSTLCDSPKHYSDLMEIISEQRFLPAGRVQLATGSPHNITAFNCLSGDTEILTKEFGSVPIKSVSNKIVTLLDGNGEWVKCPVLCHGVQTTYALNFTGRYRTEIIRSTLEHGWVSPGGETVIKTKIANHPGAKKSVGFLFPERRIENFNEYKMGVQHGLIYGDGTRTLDGSFIIRVCSNHEDVSPWFKGYGETYPPSSKGDPHYRIRRKEAWYNLKELPKVDKCSFSYLTGFIRGWIAADGCVDESGVTNLCGDINEYDWLSKYAPLIGMRIGGFSKLASVTNFGKRNKESGNIFFTKSFMEEDDFLLSKHADRWRSSPSRFSSHWRMTGEIYDPKEELVYCPVVSTTHSFALSNGIHSSNCFVGSEISDSMSGIMDELKNSALTLRMGGGCGWDFSTIRPSGSKISTMNAEASGPVSFMEMWNSMCKTIMSQGLRRGAMMGVLRVDHPDILKFIHAKKDQNSLTNFNISVAVTDEFMNAVRNGESYNLRFQDQLYGSIDARLIWDKIMKNTWDWAEPGVLFIDQINKMNPLNFCEKISSTNPCGEQPLPPNGTCLLGSFNVVKYIVQDYAGKWGRWLNIDKLRSDIRSIVRAMDNVINISKYPLKVQQVESLSKRRMGLGVTGVANAIEVLGYPYASDEYLESQSIILKTLRDEAYKTSIELSKQKGSFPLFEAKGWLSSGFSKTLPEDIRSDISKHGLRNGLLLSIAPTGTISLCADNVSSGIEPPYMLSGKRLLNLPDGKVELEVNDWAYNFNNHKSLTAEDINGSDHVKVLCEAQKYIDSAVSKTCNVGDNTTYDEFKHLYMQAWEGGAKGCTTFRRAGKRFGIMTPKQEEVSEGSACFIDPETGEKSCS